jgi:NitT/TauT family transport system substrate-binding protein
MRDGHLDIGYVGLPPAIIGVDKGIGLICIAGGHIEGTLIVGGQDARTVDQCRSMSAFLGQFSGAAIGCPPRGSIHDVIVNELLKEYRIEDVHVNNYAWADFLPDALMEAEIAAAAGTPALAVAARRYYGAHTIMPPARLWPFNPSYGIVAMRDDSIRHRDVLRRFLVAHETACEMIRHHLDKCASIVARTTGVVDAAFIAEAYQISPKYCASLPPEYVSSTMKFVNTLEALGYISRRMSETDIFDVSLINEVHTAPPHYECGLPRSL